MKTTVILVAATCLVMFQVGFVTSAAVILGNTEDVVNVTETVEKQLEDQPDTQEDLNKDLYSELVKIVNQYSKHGEKHQKMIRTKTNKTNQKTTIQHEASNLGDKMTVEQSNKSISKETGKLEKTEREGTATSKSSVKLEGDSKDVTSREKVIQEIGRNKILSTETANGLTESKYDHNVVKSYDNRPDENHADVKKENFRGKSTASDQNQTVTNTFTRTSPHDTVSVKSVDRTSKLAENVSTSDVENHVISTPEEAKVESKVWSHKGNTTHDKKSQNVDLQHDTALHKLQVNDVLEEDTIKRNNIWHDDSLSYVDSEKTGKTLNRTTKERKSERDTTKHNNTYTYKTDPKKENKAEPPVMLTYSSGDITDKDHYNVDRKTTSLMQNVSPDGRSTQRETRLELTKDDYNLKTIPKEKKAESEASDGSRNKEASASESDKEGENKEGENKQGADAETSKNNGKEQENNDDKNKAETNSGGTDDEKKETEQGKREKKKDFYKELQKEESPVDRIMRMLSKAIKD